MEIKIIRKVLESNSVPKINRVCGTNYSIFNPVQHVKNEILKEECKTRSVKLCTSIEESVISTLNNKPVFTDEQKKLISLLNEFGHIAEAEEPPEKEEEDQEEEDQEEEDQEEETGDWIGVDLDGTLAKYDGFKGQTIIGDPIPNMVDRVKQWLKDGKKVKIMTARAYPTEGVRPQDVDDAIKKWCIENIGQELPVTCQKDQHMIELWDDRAIQVVKNTGEIIGE